MMGSVQPPVPPATMPLISPSALLHAHLSQTPSPLRPSRRRPTEPRPIDVNVGALTHTHGSSLVRIGATTVVCGVRAETLAVADIPSYSSNSNNESRDDDDDDNDDIRQYNLLVPNLELSTGCSPLHPANAPPGVEAQSISQRLLSLLHASRLVRQADLEITYTPSALPSEDEEDGPSTKQVKAFWVLYIDMLCLSHGGSGSVFDAAWLALYAALRHARLPRAAWDADAAQVVCSSDVRESVALRLRGMPVPLSFGAFVPDRASGSADGGDQAATCLVDLDSFEEEAVAETGCVVVDVDSDNGDEDDDDDDTTVLHRVEKSGGGSDGTISIGPSEIRVLVGLARARWRLWQHVLNHALLSAVEPG